MMPGTRFRHTVGTVVTCTLKRGVILFGNRSSPYVNEDGVAAMVTVIRAFAIVTVCVTLGAAL